MKPTEKRFKRISPEQAAMLKDAAKNARRRHEKPPSGYLKALERLYRGTA